MHRVQKAKIQISISHGAAGSHSSTYGTKVQITKFLRIIVLTQFRCITQISIQYFPLKLVMKLKFEISNDIVIITFFWTFPTVTGNN